MFKKRWLRGLGCGAVAFLFSLLLNSLSPFKVLEWKFWDLRQRHLAQPEKADSQIALILIDQPSLDFYAQQGITWPWPRQMYAAVLDFLRKAGAKAVVIDLILSEPSAYGIEDDQLLAQAIKRQGKTFLSAGFSLNPAAREKIDLSNLNHFSLRKIGQEKALVVETHSAILPIPELLIAAHGLGNVLFSPDDDAIFRRLPLYFRWQDKLFPALPLAVAQNILGSRFKRPSLDQKGRMVLKFAGPPGTYKAYSIAALINSWVQLENNQEPQVKPDEFAGKIVFIGANAPGLLDLRPTPVSPITPGVEIQAAALDNLIQGKTVRFPPLFISSLFILFFGLAIGLGVSLISKVGWTILLLLLCFLAPAIGGALAFRSGFWLEVVPAESAVLTGFVLASLLNYSFEGRERRFIKNVFRHYLSAEIIDRILSDPSLLKLGGESREISSFFSDIAGFSTIAESLSPEELVRWLNEYLSAMTEIILQEGGTLDKYEGDAIIAFWNAPLDQPDHALRACRAALRCQQELARINPELEKIGGRPVRMRIGINSGPAIIGNMGSRKRFDYTAIGDTVNLASRLEGAAKFYGVSILISQNTYQMANEKLLVRPVDVIRVVGKRKPVEIYELLGLKAEFPAEKIESINLFSQAWLAYRQREWAQALSLFSSLPPDDLARIYIKRCQEYLSSPPPREWDGVCDLKEK